MDLPNLSATPNSLGTNFSNTMSLYKALYDKQTKKAKPKDFQSIFKTFQMNLYKSKKSVG